METVVLVAVSILGVLFVGAGGSLVFICYHHYKRKRQSLLANDDSNSHTVLSLDETTVEANTGNIELGSVITCNDETIKQLLETEEWANDVYGVIPHCIAILKMCREVTEKLVAVTMDNKEQNVHPSRINEIVVVAQCITPRVDDVMQSITPPLNLKVLEARSAALIYSVQHLALLVRNAWQSHNNLDWIDAAMDNMSQHMKILHSATAREGEPTNVTRCIIDSVKQDEELCDESPDATNQESSQL